MDGDVLLAVRDKATQVVEQSFVLANFYELSGGLPEDEVPVDDNEALANALNRHVARLLLVVASLKDVTGDDVLPFIAMSNGVVNYPYRMPIFNVMTYPFHCYTKKELSAQSAVELVTQWGDVLHHNLSCWLHHSQNFAIQDLGLPYAKACLHRFVRMWDGVTWPDIADEALFSAGNIEDGIWEIQWSIPKLKCRELIRCIESDIARALSVANGASPLPPIEWPSIQIVHDEPIAKSEEFDWGEMVPPNGYKRLQVVYDGLQPIPWRLLQYCLMSDQRCGNYDGMAEAVWLDCEMEFAGDPVKQAAKKVRDFFKRHQIPLTCSVSEARRSVQIRKSD